MRPSTPRVLSIAGSDPSGGAGIQADLKSIGANGGYGMAVITALTAQNTQGVRAVHTPPVSFLVEQLRAVSDDVSIDAVKIGMLGDAEVIGTVRGWLEEVRPPVVVLDPVMVATSGDRLLDASAEEALRALVSLADLVTPNIPELAVLLGEEPARTWPEALDQGVRLSDRTGTSVLVKGGHLDGDVCPDALVRASSAAYSAAGPARPRAVEPATAEDRIVEFTSSRIETKNTHGTGCSLSSALATVQPVTGDWAESLRLVKEWLHGALAHADELNVGTGHGPVHHFQHLFAHRAPAGSEFSRSLWDDVEDLRTDIFALSFIKALGDGSLDERHFSYYLAQDALYLNGYSRVLARASALAPTEEEQLFWANSAQVCLQVEAELHRSWLREHPAEVKLGPVTKAYVDHLTAASASGSYAVLAAAVLPCYWLYAEVGEVLHAGYLDRAGDEAHPYAAWLETYADEAFAAATRKAIEFADRAARNATAAERETMREAFRQSSVYERDFFDAPRLHA